MEDQVSAARLRKVHDVLASSARDLKHLAFGRHVALEDSQNCLAIAGRCGSVTSVILGHDLQYIQIDTDLVPGYGARLTRKAAARMPKGKEDIPLMTGPHLGGFNQPISLPELIDGAAVGAARCVAGRFQKEEGYTP